MTNRDDTVTTQLVHPGVSPYPHHEPSFGRVSHPVPDRYVLPDSRWPDFATTVPVLDEVS